MESTFRASMSWLHTWAGVVAGGLLLAIFWTGTLSVFDREIDRWMAPMTRLAMPAAFSFDVLRPSLAEAVEARAPVWSVVPPTERQPVIHVSFRDGARFVERYLDPASGAVLPDPGTWAGTRFLYPFHYMLHLRPKVIGLWLVGAAGMAMLALCVSGIVVHRKIFTDFFRFRADRQRRRLLLDLHNVTGVLGVPFHVAITLSGLIIFLATYFPSAWRVTYPEVGTFAADLYGHYARPRSNQPATIASLDAMVAKMRHLWGDGMPRHLQLHHPGDAAGLVVIRRSFETSVAFPTDVAFFDAPTGVLLHRHDAPRPMANALNFISGLHVIQFRHWTLRAAYFVLGLVGCAMIATGFLFWLEARRKRHAQLGLRGCLIVDGLTVGSVTGIVIATLSFFVANRLLPLDARALGQDRAALEIWTFYLVWLAAFAHAWCRRERAWIEQCWIIAAAAGAAVLLNWITTGHHPICSLRHRHLWAIAGMDLMLLAGAAIAMLTALALQRRQIVDRSSMPTA